MKLENIYNFFFHPCAPKHSEAIKVFSAVTIVALSILTAGAFLILFGIVQLRDRNIKVQQGGGKVSQVSSPLLTPSDSPKVQRIKQKHAEQLNLFEKWAREGDWKMFKPAYSHYDWWTFPVMRPSAGYGDTYAVTQADIEALKKDAAFMQGYRRAVELVVKSWGWDLKNDRPISSPDQRWEGYGVRLGKMADSLQLLGEKELYDKLQLFFNQVCLPQSGSLPLESWVIQALKRH